MPTSIPPPSGSSFFASMTASDYVTAVIAIASFFIALFALCVPLWKSRTRFEVRDTYSRFCNIDLAILDFVLVNRSGSPIAITGIEVVGGIRVPARRYSQEIPDNGRRENGKIVRKDTTEFPITIAPYESKRVIAGFDQTKYGECIGNLICSERQQKEQGKSVKSSVYKVRSLCIHTSRRDKTYTIPFKAEDMG